MTSATYQGHCADGSSVQKHSAGGIYPYIVFAKDTPRGIRYGLLCPDGWTSNLYPHAYAVRLALRFKQEGKGL